MVFAYDTEQTLLGAAGLVNTAVPPDTLTDDAGLRELLDRFFMSGPIEHSPAELRRLRAVRGVLRELWCGDAERVVALCNELLLRYRALPQIVRHDDWNWHLHAIGSERPLADRFAVDTAMAMADVLRADELDRLRICEDEDCAAVVVDLSRNRSRRYCDRGCGNRANVAAYRARQRRSG